jgi:hypothetical protein
MSSPSEPDPTNPNDLTYYAPRELRERAKAVSLSEEARSGPASRSPISHPPSLDIQLQKPVYLRRPPTPEVIHEPAGLARASLFGVAGRIAAVAAFVAVVALLFGFILVPASRQSDAGSLSSESTGSIRTALPQSSQQENGSKPALAEFQGVLASAPASQPATNERPQQLLQQFLQWRKKANSTETSH